MIKKFLLIPLFVLALFFGYILEAGAYIQNDYDLQVKIQNLQELRDFDTMKLINKAELIGYRLDDFNSARLSYNSSINYTIDQLKQIQFDISNVENNVDLDEQGKFMQKQKLYQNANAAISNLNNQTNMYLENIKYPMPTITYERYRAKFWNFYNSLGF